MNEFLEAEAMNLFISVFFKDVFLPIFPFTFPEERIIWIIDLWLVL